MAKHLRRKTIKKPSFVISYWQCLAVVAAFLALIGLMIYGSVSGEYNNRAARRSGYDSAAIGRTIATTFNKENVTAQDIVILKNQLVWHYSSTGQAFEVYYNKQKVADSSRNMIMHYCPESFEEEPPIYFFELADIKYLQYFDTPEVQKYKAIVPVIDLSDGMTLNPKYDEQPVLEIGVKEAYINMETGKFIPVVCYVLDTQSAHELNISSVTVTIPVDKNSPELKGYTYIRSDGINNFSASIEGYEGAEPEYCDNTATRNDFDVFYGYKSSYIKVKSFEDVYKTWIMAGNCALVVLMLALSLIPASLLYNRRKRNYEIFEYRRKTTDAMAHDLKTPMAAILSYAENLENNTGTDKQEFYVSKITEKVWQMNKMVNNMLDFSRGENASVAVKKTPVEVNTDKDLFAQAIGNLINNAALYAKEGTEISVTCEPGKIVIANVTAAPVDDAEALKQPFAKGDESRRNYGSGLGLAIAENNLVLLGFKLDVKSEGDKFVATVTL